MELHWVNQIFIFKKNKNTTTTTTTTEEEEEEELNRVKESVHFLQLVSISQQLRCKHFEQLLKSKGKLVLMTVTS